MNWIFVCIFNAIFWFLLFSFIALIRDLIKKRQVSQKIYDICAKTIVKCDISKIIGKQNEE